MYSSCLVSFELYVSYLTLVISLSPKTVARVRDREHTIHVYARP